MDKNISLLIVDDEAEAVLSLTRALSASQVPHRILGAGNAETALRIQEEYRPQVAVVDLSLNELEGVSSGLSLVKKLIERDQSIRVIVLTGHGSARYGIESLRAGAASFLQKPADVPHLVALITDATLQAELRRENESLRSAARGGWDQWVGGNDSSSRITEELRFAAFSPQSVLLLGETGTGKSMAARLIHEQSVRGKKPFIRYQPTFGSPDLVNSDLFGHKKGAFTGATEDRRGLFMEASGGSLFLDEIDEFPAANQVALLGVLQEGKARAVGANTEYGVDTRILCASNRNMEDAVSSGKLRGDLFHRISQIRITIPPLRERPDDVEPIARSFIRRLADTEEVSVRDMEPSVLNVLHDYRWPGNVRELESVIVAACYRAQFRGDSTIRTRDLSVGRDASQTEAISFHERVLSFKRTLIRDALAQTKGNQVQAAKVLGLDRMTLRRLMNDRSDDS